MCPFFKLYEGIMILNTVYKNKELGISNLWIRRLYWKLGTKTGKLSNLGF